MATHLKRYPAPMGKPPKIRSFIDHWPQTSDMRRNNPLAGTYVDHYAHFPANLPHDVKRQPRGYVDHFAEPGDTRRI